MNFIKMHGAGNDFVFVDRFTERVADPADVARRMCDRHAGVGADGLILICPSTTATVRMEMYNTDGSRSQMCGNGIRCVAKYAYERGLTREASIPIETDDGVKLAECTVEGGRVTRVRMDMGRPRFAPQEIPVRLTGPAVVNHPIEINGKPFRMTCVSMGNPHAIIFVDDLQSVALNIDGPAVERHSLFPERVNVHFVRVVGPTRVTMRTWERGSGATRACGTGASAVCVAGVRTERTQRRITACVPGGELELEWSEAGSVYMTGPAVEVFHGHWPGE
ncbi:MAG: diaminopimelate epimerase [Phycisphaerales bacterium]|nr:diaminopimelate epimerase [Phycisphaerales bacterium]